MTDIITLAFVVQMGGIALPPQRFDHEPNVPYEIVHVPDEKSLQEVCQMPFRTPNLLACREKISGFLQPTRQTIFIRTDMTKEVYDLVLRHEKGHVNGWEHNPQ